MESLFLAVGLGNPGDEYARTRHNAGFLVVEELGRRNRAAWSFEKKFNARVARKDLAHGKLMLAQPQTFMNLSGESVAGLAGFYRLPVERLLIVLDDADLPLGEIRLRPKGSSGGHHGLESVEKHLGTREYARLKVGIGRQDGRRDIAGHVLGRFGAEESALLEKVLGRAADQVETWMAEGIERAMNRFNGVVN